MASKALITGSIIVLTSIAALYVLEITFGAFMDGFYNIAVNLTASMGTSGVLPAQWNTTATKTLENWKFFYRSISIIIIALFIWLIRLLFVDTQSERPY